MISFSEALAEQLQPTVAQSKEIAKLPKWSSPAELATALDPRFQIMPHIEYISDSLKKAYEDVTIRNIRRLLILNTPPRVGKTLLVATQLPLWLLHQNPNLRIGYVTREVRLATKSGRGVRREIEDHGEELDLYLAPDLQSAQQWETTDGGGYSCFGINGNITGHGFDVLILDDLVQDMNLAHSENDREKLWEWLTTTALTRLHPPGLLLAIGTRWHEDDWLGKLEAHYKDDPALEVVKIPALALQNDPLGRREGQPLLSPLVRLGLPLEAHNTKEEVLANINWWKDRRHDVGENAWAAEFQQDPTPAGGDIFKTEWWNEWDNNSLPDNFDRVLTSWDLSFKGKKSSDYVVGTKWGFIGADAYLLDIVREQADFVATKRMMISFCENVTENLVEDKANGPAIIAELKSTIPGLIAVTPLGSKEARARSVSPMIEAGNVYLPKHHKYRDVLDHELATFPNGKHDDIVDSLTQALDRVRARKKSHISTPNAVMVQDIRAPRLQNGNNTRQRVPNRGSIVSRGQRVTLPRQQRQQ